MYREIRSYLPQKSPLKGLLVRRGMKSCPSRSSLSRIGQPLTALPLEHKICQWQSLCGHRSAHPSSSLPAIPHSSVTNHASCRDFSIVGARRGFFSTGGSLFTGRHNYQVALPSLPTIRMAEAKIGP